MRVGGRAGRLRRGAACGARDRRRSASARPGATARRRSSRSGSRCRRGCTRSPRSSATRSRRRGSRSRGSRWPAPDGAPLTRADARRGARCTRPRRGARLPTEDEWQLAAEAGLLERRRPLVWNWTESEHSRRPHALRDPQGRLRLEGRGLGLVRRRRRAGAGVLAEAPARRPAPGSARIGFRLAVDLCRAPVDVCRTSVTVSDTGHGRNGPAGADCGRRDGEALSCSGRCRDCVTGAWHRTWLASRAHRDTARLVGGIRVVEAATLFAAPLAGMFLGDFGADVIKIEHPPRPDPARGHGPSKDGEGLWFKSLGRNKRLITLDLSKPDGRDALPPARRATPTSCSRTSGPGRSSAGALGPDELSAVNPRLVLARVSGFGQTGPYAHARRVRHARRGDERLRGAERRARRAAAPAAARARRRRRRRSRPPSRSWSRSAPASRPAAGRSSTPR